MTTPDNSTKRCGDIAIEFDHNCDDPVTASKKMLAYNLAKLPAAEREAELQRIEDGSLRKWVSGFVASQGIIKMRRQLTPFGAGWPQ